MILDIVITILVSVQGAVSPGAAVRSHSPIPVVKNLRKDVFVSVQMKEMKLSIDHSNLCYLHSVRAVDTLLSDALPHIFY